MRRFEVDAAKVEPTMILYETASPEPERTGQMLLFLFFSLPINQLPTFFT